MMDYNNLMWFGVCFLFLILEMGHPGLLYFLSFSCGALIALLISLIGLSFTMQLGSFLAGTCGALLLVHFLVKKKMKELQSSAHRSNTDALVGKKVVVYQSNHDEQIWYAQLNGQVWLVRCVHGKALQEGQQAVVVAVQGCHLKVDNKN